MGAKVEEGEKRGGQKVGSGSEVRKSYFTDYCGCMQLNCAHTDRHIMQSSERRLILTMQRKKTAIKNFGSGDKLTRVVQFE